MSLSYSRLSQCQLALSWSRVNLTLLAKRIRSLFVFKFRNCSYKFLSRHNLCTEMSKNSFQFSNFSILKIQKRQPHFLKGVAIDLTKCRNEHIQRTANPIFLEVGNQFISKSPSSNIIIIHHPTIEFVNWHNATDTAEWGRFWFFKNFDHTVWKCECQKNCAEIITGQICGRGKFRFVFDKCTSFNIL